MRIDILIPVFNTKADHLLQSVYSIYRNINKRKHRIILLDDGSSEEETLAALDFLESFCKVVHFDCNEGTSVVLNKGHELVECEYVAIAGSDDIYHPERFPMQISYLKKNPEVDVLGTEIYWFFEDNLWVKNGSHIIASGYTNHGEKPDLSKNWFVNHGTVIYKQDAVMSVGGYNEKLRRRQDVELWGRMKNEGFEFRNIPEVLAAWRRYRDRNLEQ